MGDASAIVANSAWTAAITSDLVTELGIQPAPKIHVVELGTDPTWFRPDRDSGHLRQRLGLEGQPMMLTVARLVPHKGQDMAIASLARVRDQIPGTRYLIVGTGPDETRLRELAVHYGVNEFVVFAGALSEEDLAEAYATADVYVGLSRVHEVLYAKGFGISFLEAMASGTAVVAGDTGGVRSAVTNGVTALLVVPTDVIAVTDALTAILHDAPYRSTFEKAGRDAVLRHYNWDRVAAGESQG